MTTSPIELNTTKPYLTINKIWIGIFWKILSCAFFAGINATARYLTGGTTELSPALSIYTIIFYQNILGAGILLSIFSIKNVNFTVLIPKKYYWIHFIRVTSAAVGMGLWYLSLKYLPISEVVALSFIAPTLTILGAIIFLRERLSWSRAIAFILTTFGGLLMTRPDLHLKQLNFNFILFLPLLAALIFAFDKLLTRKLLALDETPACVTFALLAFMAPISLILALISQAYLIPSIQHWPWLVLLALLGVGAHFSFSKAYYYAEITTLLPFGLSKIILCSIIGFIAFGEYPKSLDLGLGIIILTICTIIYGINNKKSNL